MKIGSSNALTYLRPIKWWHRVFRWKHKHQEYTYDEQYYFGCVRFFDIRLGVSKTNKMIVKNGKCIFNTFSLYEVFDFLNKRGDATVMLTLDVSLDEVVSSSYRELEKRFIDFCNASQMIYTNVVFCGGIRSVDEKVLYRFRGNMPTVYKAEDVSGKYWFWNKYFPPITRFFNKKLIREYRKDDGYLLINFVDYK